MKMMIQADDYGITTAVTDGIVACAREGVMTQTGLFTNMPCTEYAVKRIAEYPQVLLGIDLNLSTGSPVTAPEKIPSLVQENGAFLTSGMHKELDKTDRHHVRYEDAFLEYDNQVKRFIELVGRKPGYVGGHAWSSEETNRALDDIAEKYGLFNVMRETNFTLEEDLESQWARPVIGKDGKMEFNVMTQMENDPLQMFIDGKLKKLEEALHKDEAFLLHTHAGFLDRDLLKISSYNMLRAMEAGFLMSRELKDWIKSNRVELVTYLDVYR